MTPTVFAYTDVSHYLRDVLDAKKRTNPLFSMRAWAKQMGFRCHTSLVFLLSGKRKVKPDHLGYLTRGLRLSNDEELYLTTLVHLGCAASMSEKAHYESRLQLLKPTQEDALLDVEKFRLVADWIHMAILEMTLLHDFEPSAAWIQKRLKFNVSLEQIREATDRLLQLGLLIWSDGHLIKSNARLTTPKDRASECIREHHRQVLGNAIEAIEGQTIQERVYNSCTMTIDPSRLPEAKELIEKFRADMAKLMEKTHGQETYQLSVQFFKLTQNSPQT